MSRVVVLGAGISGHTAAAFLRKWLGRDDDVIVVSPKPTYNWIPSNIWVGVGLMSPPSGDSLAHERAHACGPGVDPGQVVDDPETVFPSRNMTHASWCGRMPRPS